MLDLSHLSSPRLAYTYVLGVCGEAVVDSSRHDHKIVLVELDPDPIVSLAAYVEKPSSVDDVSNFFVFMEVFIEESLDLFLVHVAHGRRRYGDDIPVLVLPLCSQGVYIFYIWVVEMQYTQLGEIVRGDFTARVVRFTLVALDWIRAAEES